MNAGQKETNSVVVKFKQLVDQDKDKLFDVFQQDRAKLLKLQIDWRVSMSPKEYIYYEDQKTARKMFCDRGIDPVYEAVRLREERYRERLEANREARARQFEMKTMDEVKRDMIDRGEMTNSSGESFSDCNVEDEEVTVKETPENTDQKAAKIGTKQKFVKRPECEDDPLPKKFRHIREGERTVRENFYQTVASLSGAGLSLQEATSAVVLVGNGLFERNWKTNDETDLLDKDTAPTKKQIREANRLIEAQSLSLALEKVESQKAEGRMVTHAMDSTTKRGVGQFAVQGLHIGQDSPFPLPILSIHGETTEDIATQVTI